MSEYQFLNNRNGDNGSDDNDNVCGGETHDGNDNVRNIYLEAGNFDRKDNQFGIKEVVENCACESDKKKNTFDSFYSFTNFNKNSSVFLKTF